MVLQKLVFDGRLLLVWERKRGVGSGPPLAAGGQETPGSESDRVVLELHEQSDKPLSGQPSHMRSSEGVELVVRGAAKRDAGRGIVRLSDETMSELGILSGETIAVSGERETVAKVWPGDAELGDEELRIDGDTRANAGLNIGDTARVAPVSVGDARSVQLELPSAFETVDVDEETLASAAKRDLVNRPIAPDQRVRLPRLGDATAIVTDTDPDGTVQVTERTDLRVRRGTVSGRDTSGERQGSEANSAAGDRETDAANPAGAEARSQPVTAVTYEDIGGLDEELELVRETIELPLSEPEVFTRLGIEPPKGVLLHGPPGTGKTLIAKAVANEVDATFLSVSGPEITSKYKGESEEQLRELFAEASENAPAIVFFDEIDSIAGKRDDEGGMESRVVGQLLSLMDGLDAREDVIVIGATNRVDTLDPALRRGGRFDREIQIGVPGESGRREILEVHTRRMPLGPDVELDQLAARTYGFVGADLDALTTEAALAALRRTRKADVDAGIEDLEVTRADFETALAAVEPSAMREYVAETPTTTFADVGGLEEPKETLRRAVTWPLSYGPLFEAAGTDPPTGVLLHGPPGTGKTLLARAIAGESQVNFIQVAGPELLDRYVGESEKAVREVFERARQAAPSIVFFDEIDAIADDRNRTGDSSVGKRVVSQLLTELDRASDNPNLAVLAATNRRDALDQALLRPGRLESHVEVPAPDEEARRAILAVHTADTPLARGVDLDAIASRTAGYSGADITAVCREAAMQAVERVAAEHGETANHHADEVTVTAADFETGLERVSPSL